MFNTPEGKKVLNYGAIVLIVLGVFLAIQAIYTLRATSYLGRGLPPTNVITVSGKGEILAKPDIATFSFGVTATDQTVGDAQRIVTGKINKAIEVVRSAGVEEKDIKTISYSISPHYESSDVICTPYSCPPSNQKITGYDVNQTVEVRVREIEKASEILTQLGPVEVTNLSGISFTIDDEEKLQDEAQNLAITDAKERAKALAKQLGVRLGKVVNFNQNDYMPYYREAYGMGGDMAAASAPKVDLPAGENTIIANVSVMYEIK